MPRNPSFGGGPLTGAGLLGCLCLPSSWVLGPQTAQEMQGGPRTLLGLWPPLILPAVTPPAEGPLSLLGGLGPLGYPGGCSSTSSTAPPGKGTPTTLSRLLQGRPVRISREGAGLQLAGSGSLLRASSVLCVAAKA